VAAIRQHLGRVERAPDSHWPEQWANLCKLVGQSPPGTGRQRRSALRLPRRSAHPTCHARRCAKDYPLCRVAAWRGRREVTRHTTELDRGGFVGRIGKSKRRNAFVL